MWNWPTMSISTPTNINEHFLEFHNFSKTFETYWNVPQILRNVEFRFDEHNNCPLTKTCDSHCERLTLGFTLRTAWESHCERLQGKRCQVGESRKRAFPRAAETPTPTCEATLGCNLGFELSSYLQPSYLCYLERCPEISRTMFEKAS